MCVLVCAWTYLFIFECANSGLFCNCNSLKHKLDVAAANYSNNSDNNNNNVTVSKDNTARQIAADTRLVALHLYKCCERLGCHSAYFFHCMCVGVYSWVSPCSYTPVGAAMRSALVFTTVMTC